MSSVCADERMLEPKLSNWDREQNILHQKIIDFDDKDVHRIIRIGGLDISTPKDVDTNIVCVTLVVMDFETLKVLYEDSQLEELNIPYKAGYLGFREVPLFKNRVEQLKKNPQLMPQVFLVDGNGKFHVRRCGSASHLGVECDVPTIGVAKNLQCLENEGITRDEQHKSKIDGLQAKGDHFPITTNSGETIAMALRTSPSGKKPVYVSTGHKCSLETAVRIVLQCSKFRIPEPIRQADMISREILRKKYSQ